MSKISIKNMMSALDNAKNNTTEEKQFVKDFERCIVEEASENVRVPSKTFKPSSLGGCERNLFFQLTGVTPKADNQSCMLVGICESGTDRHIRIQQHIINMKKHGIDCEYIDIETFVKERNLTDIEIISKDGIETKCYNKRYNISFLTDGIIRYKGQYYILEIKTETERKYKEHDTYRPEHEAQGITYRISFGIDKVMYLYENRNTTAHKAFIFHVTDEATQAILDKMSYVNSCLETGEVPPMTKDSSKCKYCLYTEECSKYGY